MLFLYSRGREREEEGKKRGKHISINYPLHTFKKNQTIYGAYDYQPHTGLTRANKFVWFITISEFSWSVHCRSAFSLFRFHKEHLSSWQLLKHLHSVGCYKLKPGRNQWLKSLSKKRNKTTIISSKHGLGTPLYRNQKKKPEAKTWN